MATSGSVNFKRNRNELIISALRLLNVYGTGETPEHEDVSLGAEVLNMMVKSWQADGIGLWLIQRATVLLEKDKQSYLLGPTGDHVTHSHTETTLSAAASSGASTVDLTSVSGLSSGDYIGVAVDDGTAHWTTVNGAPSGSTVTLAAALDDDAASGNTVYFYTAKINRPKGIVDAQFEQSSGTDSYERELDFISRDEYFRLTSKDTTGKAVQVYHDAQLTNAVLYVWPAADSVEDKIHISVRKELDDFDNITDDAHFPNEWTKCIVWNLACDLAPYFGVDMTGRMQVVKADAFREYMRLKTFDNELTSIQFYPDRMARGRRR